MLVSATGKTKDYCQCVNAHDVNILLAGDARGRIFSWSVTEQPGRGVADHWLKDEGADQCVKCHVK